MKDHNQVEQGGDGSLTLDNPVWTALITPFREDGSVHMKDLMGLVRRQDVAGNGILLFGSTGEGLALSTREKKEILDEVVTLSLRVPLMGRRGRFAVGNTTGSGSNIVTRGQQTHFCWLHRRMRSQAKREWYTGSVH